jgi:hypothetical protein
MVRSEDVVRLNPRRSPGRLNRKALAYASEIGRLWSEGHSIAAIAEALLDAGVTVSLCTVRREIKRHKALPQHTGRVVVRQPERVDVRSAPLESIVKSTGDPRTSKEIAAAFVKGRITNPLLRSRITP